MEISLDNLAENLQSSIVSSVSFDLSLVHQLAFASETGASNLRVDF